MPIIIDLEAELSDINLRLNSAEIDSKKLNPLKASIKSYIYRFKGIKDKPFEEAKAMVAILVDSVIVTEDDVYVKINTCDGVSVKKNPHSN